METKYKLFVIVFILLMVHQPLAHFDLQMQINRIVEENTVHAKRVIEVVENGKSVYFDYANNHEIFKYKDEYYVVPIEVE